VYWDKSQYPYPRWTDEKVDEDKFIRSYGEYKYHIDKGEISYWEKHSNFPDMLMESSDQVQDIKIGSLDL